MVRPVPHLLSVPATAPATAPPPQPDAVRSVVPRRTGGAQARAEAARAAARLALALLVAAGLGAGTTVVAVRAYGPSGERVLWAATTVSTPDRLYGQYRVASPRLDSWARAEQARLATAAGTSPVLVAVYGPAAGPR